MRYLMFAAKTTILQQSQWQCIEQCNTKHVINSIIGAADRRTKSASRVLFSKIAAV